MTSGQTEGGRVFLAVSHISHSQGRRRNRWERRDQCFGTVHLKTRDRYCKNPPILQIGGGTQSTYCRQHALKWFQYRLRETFHMWPPWVKEETA